MNNINGFTFFRNIYELLDNLDTKNKRIMLETIVDYMFKDIEPNLTGMNKAIWLNIVMVLNKSKRNIKNGSKGGRKPNNEPKQEPKKEPKKKPKEEPKKKPKEEPQKKANIFSTFLFLFSNFNFSNELKNKIEEWFKYKLERKENYTETGFKNLLKQIEHNVNIYGETKVINLITECMASNYKGIIFEKLKPSKKEGIIPEWFGKKIKSEEITAEEEQEINEMLKEFK